MLTWLDGRNDSSFQGLSYGGGLLRFTVARASGSNGLQAMVPADVAAGGLTKLVRNGAPVDVTTRTVKGIEYATFEALSGSYVAAYGGAVIPPEPPGGGGQAAATQAAATQAAATQAALRPAVPAASAGAGSAGSASGSTGASSATAIGGSAGGVRCDPGPDRKAPRVTIVKRTVRATKTGLVTLRVACPRGELRCRVELRLRRAGRRSSARA